MANRKYVPSPEVLAKERQALEMRRAGVELPEIARQLKYADKSGAAKAVKRALRRAVHGDSTLQQQLQGSRYDRLLTAYYPAAMRGDTDAARVVLQTMRQIEDLFGIKHSDGLAERMVKLSEEQGIQIAEAIRRILDGLQLTREQWALVPQVVPPVLRALSAGTADPDDEDQDIIDIEPEQEDL